MDIPFSQPCFERKSPIKRRQVTLGVERPMIPLNGSYSPPKLRDDRGKDKRHKLFLRGGPGGAGAPRPSTAGPPGPSGQQRGGNGGPTGASSVGGGGGGSVISEADIKKTAHRVAERVKALSASSSSSVRSKVPSSSSSCYAQIF